MGKRWGADTRKKEWKLAFEKTIYFCLQLLRDGEFGCVNREADGAANA
jgi:hypothetical protein